MSLEEIKSLILKSEREDWQIIACESFGNGPSYKNKLVFSGVLENEEIDLVDYSHRNIAVYTPNVAITMAYGLVDEKELEFEWLSQFECDEASSYFLDIFYHNALIHREKYLLVDEVRCVLPYPIHKGKEMRLQVSVEQYRLIGLLHLLEADRESKEMFDAYFDQSGIELSKGDL